MAKAYNLELQGGTYHVRLDVPKDVQKAFEGRKVLSQSLKTGVHKEALDRRLPILAVWKAQITAARNGLQLPEGWQDDVISLNAKIGQMFEHQKLSMVGVAAPPLPAIDPSLEARMKSNPQLVAAFEAFVKEHLKGGMEGKVRLIDEMGNGIQSLIPQLLTKRYNVPATQQEEVKAVLANPTSYRAKSPVTAARLKAFRAYRVSHGIAEKTIAQQESKLRDLSKHLQDSQASLDFDAVTAWLDGMNLSSKTKQQYLLAGSMFWKWASKHDAQWRETYKNHVNPFEKHDLPQLKGKARKDASRKAFTIEELSALHVAATKQGLITLADLIVLGSYTGARIEELCQLRTENLVQIDGVLCFDITDSKTAAGIRAVPVHPALSKLVARLKAEANEDYLIPSASRNKYGIRSDALSKAFGRLKSSMGFGPLHVFHSIRASVITHLVRADVADRLIKELVGHETGTVTFDVYSQGSSAQQKLAAISKLPTLTTDAI